MPERVLRGAARVAGARRRAARVLAHPSGHAARAPVPEPSATPRPSARRAALAAGRGRELERLAARPARASGATRRRRSSRRAR